VERLMEDWNLLWGHSHIENRFQHLPVKEEVNTKFGAVGIDTWHWYTACRSGQHNDNIRVAS
jgi:hypothetical protein